MPQKKMGGGKKNCIAQTTTQISFLFLETMRLV